MPNKSDSLYELENGELTVFCLLFKRKGTVKWICHNYHALLCIHGMLWRLLFDWYLHNSTSIHYHVRPLNGSKLKHKSVSSQCLKICNGGTLDINYEKNTPTFQKTFHPINCTNSRSLMGMFDVPMANSRLCRDNSKVPFWTNEQSVDMLGELVDLFSP